jgi:hypothetical protein
MVQALTDPAFRSGLNYAHRIEKLIYHLDALVTLTCLPNITSASKNQFNFSPTLNDFIQKLPEPKKPEKCGDCIQYDRFHRKCKIDGHKTSPATQACRQAIEKTAQRSF